MRFLFSYIFVSLLCFFSFRAISTPVTDILFIQNKALGTTAATASQKVAENLEAQIVNLYAITDEELIYDKTDPDMLVKMINNIYENGVFKSRLNIATNLSGISELSKNIEKVESIIALKKILGDSVSAAKSAKAMFSIAKDASKIKTRYRVLNNLIRYGTGNRESLYQLKLFLNNIDDASKAGSYLYETYQFIKKVDSIEKTTNKGLDAIRYLLVHVQSEIAHEMAVNLKSGQWAKLVIQDFILKRWKEDGRYGDYVNQNMISYIRDESCLKLLTFGCKVKIVTSNSIVDERELELSPITFHLKSTPIENEANKYLIEIPSSLISEWKIGDIESIKFTEFGEELDLSQTNVSDVTYLSSDQTPNSLVISLNEDNLFYYISARVIFNSGEEYLFYDKEVSYISNPDSIDVLEYPSDVQAENDAKIKVKSCGDFLYEASFWYKNTSRDTWFKSYLNIDSSSYDGECYTYNFSVLGAELDSHIWSGDNFDFYISGGTQKSSIHKSFLIDANDIDNDGMNDSCENEYFKGLNEKAQDDYDHDGVINVLECSQGTDPTKPGTEGVSKTLQINNHLLEDGTAINTCRLDDIYLSHVDVSCSNVTLYENVTISGDMSITSNKFNLNGYRLTVGGSLSIQGNLNINDGVTYVGKDIIHTSGTLDMSGGSLIVKGDYRIQKPDDINGGYTFSDGILRMEGDNDYLIVEGDFVMDSRYGGFKTGSTYSIHYNGDWLTAGTLEVKGDFTQLSSAKSHCSSGYTDCSYYSEQNFQASGSHKVVLSGEALQTVTFTDPAIGNSKFNVLDIKNTSLSGVTMDSPIYVVGGISSTGTPIEGASNIHLADLFFIDGGEWPYDLTVSGPIDLTHELSVTGSLFIKGGVNLSGYPLSVDGNVTVYNGTLDIASASFDIAGNMLQEGGGIELNNGSLKIKGDYRIQKPDDSDSGYTYSEGILRMEDDNDYLLVEGDFVMDSRYGGFKTGSTYSIHYRGDWLTAGTLEVKGDFTQLSSAKSHCSSGITDCNYYSEQNFQASGSHKVVLSGETLQTVAFADPSSGNSRFYILDVKNTSQEGIVFASKLAVEELYSSDDSFISNVIVETHPWTLYDNQVVKGDMKIDGSSLKLNGYTLTVEGDIIHTSGTLDMSGGSLIIKGDYRIQKPDDINGGYTSSDGILRMEGDNDYLIVEGDFVMDSRYGGFKTGSTYSIHYNGDWLTAGTLEVKGDFTQLSSAKSNCNSGITDCNYYSEQNFQASGTHKVALSGTELQTVHFEDSTNSYFNELEIKNINNEGIKFSTSPKVVKLFNHNRLVFNSELGGSFVDYDEDGIKDNIDEFPMNANNVGVDTDLDGIPDFQDTDDDNDGILDAVDAFSLNVAASIDTDLDGLPDSFHASCNDECITESGLILDLDDDNDGISDDEDDYPLDQGKSKDNRIALNIYVPESAYNVAVGETVTIPVMYKASDDSQISALSFKLYFNSQLLQWNQVTNLISTGLLGGMDTVFVDENDSDNNALTDSYLQVTWFDLSKNWPGESGVVKLFDIEFTLLQDLAEDTTSLSIVGDETGVSTGYKVVSEPINIAMNSNSFSLDVNGDGKVSLPVDGFIILRSMVGFPAPALASNDDMFDATRTREEMADLLNNAKTDLSLDINGDGKVSLPIDGFIILRHMVGFPASALASDEDMVGATRTRDEMKSYLTGSQ